VSSLAPDSTTRLLGQFVRRETVGLVLLVVVCVGAFAGTRALARANRATRRADAAAWYAAGQRQLAGRESSAAVASFRKAVAIERDNRIYRLSLADALVAAGDDDAAYRVLLGTREIAPDESDVNLRLARVEARQGRTTEAVRSYQSALHGTWHEEDAATRRRARLELVRLLLSAGDQSRALAELLVLDATLPDVSAAQTEAGTLYLAAGDPARALAHFRRALDSDPHDAAASFGAGRAAFDLGDYREAIRRLRAAAPDVPGARDLLVVAQLVRSADPLAPRLSLGERRRRLLDAVDHVEAIAEHCSVPPEAAAGLETLATLAPSLELKALRQAPETVESTFDLLAGLHAQLVQACGSHTDYDRAFALIAKRHETAETTS
jgi:tetratricopeptide (TPR) repeat protein